MDEWSKHFFRAFFSTLLLCCLVSLVDIIIYPYIDSILAIMGLASLESFFLSVSMPMLTAYMVHCRGEKLKDSIFVRIALVLWSVFFILQISTFFSDNFYYIGPDDQYYRGNYYSVMMLPIIAIMILNLAVTIVSRKRLPKKYYYSFLIATIPLTIALVVHEFTDAIAFIDISIVLSAIAMYGLILSDQLEENLRQQQEIARQQHEIAQQQQEIAHQRASVMVLQMRPHFVYNTLMSIYSLCNQDPQKARKVTMDFTNYLRKNFNAVASENTIPFTAELEHTRAYLDVEKAQHEDMLVVFYDIDFTNFRLPPLTLQPIVENAVKHGMDPYSGPLHVIIRTRHSESGTEITVADNGSGFQPSTDSKTNNKHMGNDDPHIALENIEQRLKMMCGGEMNISPREGGGTIVKIML